jgi:hypothetical protein
LVEVELEVNEGSRSTLPSRSTRYVKVEVNDHVGVEKL